METKLWNKFFIFILDMIRTFNLFFCVFTHICKLNMQQLDGKYFLLVVYNMLTLHWKNKSPSETEHIHLRTQTFLLQVFFFSFFFLTKVSTFYRKIIFVRVFALKRFHFLIYLYSRKLHEHIIFYLICCWGKAGIIKIVNTYLALVMWIFDHLNR